MFWHEIPFSRSHSKGRYFYLLYCFMVNIWRTTVSIIAVYWTVHHVDLVYASTASTALSCWVALFCRQKCQSWTDAHNERGWKYCKQKFSLFVLFACLSVVVRPDREYFSHIESHHCWWRAAEPRPILGTYSLWGRDLYRATPAMTRGLGFVDE